MRVSLSLSFFRIFSILLVFTVYASTGTFAATKGKAARSPVIMEDKRISIDAKGHKLSAILKEIGKEAKVAIDLPGGYGDEPVNIKLKGLEVREALGKLLSRDYVFLLGPGDKPGSYELKKVIVGAGRWSPKSLRPGFIAAWDFRYGSKSALVGVDKKKNLGPTAYTVSRDGRIIVSDTVNNRVQIFSDSGNHLSSIRAGEGTIPDDIAVDHEGRVFLYDGKNKRIIQFDPAGRPVTEVKVDEKRWRSRRGVKVAGNGLYIYGCNFSVCGDMMVGIMSDGLLSPPGKKELGRPVAPGEIGSGGRRYETQVARYESGSLKVYSQTGKLFKSIDFPVKGIETLEYLGDDEDGHFYVKLEWSGKMSLNAEVREFDRDGELVRKVRLPDAGVSNWPSIRTVVDHAGTIYDLVAGDEYATLYIIP